MQTEKQSLSIKLAANSERLARKDFLSKLPENLRRYLSEKNYLQIEEKNKIVETFWISKEGIGNPSYKPNNYSFQEFSWKKDVLLAAKSFSNKYYKEEAFFYPFMDNPIYCVEFGWVTNNLSELFDNSNGSLGVVTKDLCTGLVISNYCGYLPYDPNPNEIVFELATWSNFS